ncbi:DinB family protein [Fictibacillus phosphorivorans]|uniref:DinB family protein n=1 Tax=Fictibacillus phosphorivorans TaxID=1221500 RepID=UPI001293F116|nr:DinB family protein [Fictibacillus phosphorivorans]MQR97053.1 DinB family protein [Fictibacillus phosphorivorans]
MLINDKVRQDLLAEVKGINNEDLNKKPSESEWSIKEILEHLYLMEGGIAKNIKHQLQNGKVVNAEMKPIEATVNRNIKVDAPEFAVPSSEFASIEELKMNLAATHQHLLDIENTAEEKDLEAKGFSHPIFGDISLKQWIPFVAYHEQRHILQIKEVKEKLIL